MNQALKDYKNIISSYYPQYQLTFSDDDTLSYKYEKPAKSPSCSMAGCLLLLGIIPGLIYFFIAKEDAKVYTLNINHNKLEDKIIITGSSPNIYAIKGKYDKLISKKNDS